MMIKRDYEKEPLQVLSYGGGIQSTALLLLVIEGRLPAPDLVIHSDTGSEMPHTAPVIEWAQKECRKLSIPFKIVRSHLGALHEAYQEKGALPMVGVRSCTVNFKIAPLNRFLRTIVGDKNGVLLAQSWIGISTDEARRRQKSKLIWAGIKFPLLDDVPLSRNQCGELVKKHNLNVKKSACFCCPYGGVKHFISLRAYHPALFEVCVKMEETMKAKRPERRDGLCPKVRDLSSLRIDSLENYGFDFADMVSCEPEGGCFL